MPFQKPHKISLSHSPKAEVQPKTDIRSTCEPDLTSHHELEPLTVLDSHCPWTSCCSSVLSTESSGGAGGGGAGQGSEIKYDQVLLLHATLSDHTCCRIFTHDRANTIGV